MFMKCCNPKCEAPFDYREGRLIRFSWNPPKGCSPDHFQVIEHFWLCGKCSALYEFKNEPGNNVTVRPRAEQSSQDRRFHSTLVA
jgi:hypothetical protein